MSIDQDLTPDVSAALLTHLDDAFPTAIKSSTGTRDVMTLAEVHILQGIVAVKQHLSDLHAMSLQKLADGED